MVSTAPCPGYMATWRRSFIVTVPTLAAFALDDTPTHFFDFISILSLSVTSYLSYLYILLRIYLRVAVKNVLAEFVR